MPTDELKWYIEQAALRGLLKEAKEKLLNAGWSADDIERAFVALKPVRQRRTLLLAGVALGVGFLGSWAGLYTIFSSVPDISYQQYSEIGDEVVVVFASDVGADVAKRRFAISPESKGDLVWMSDVRELHFVPYEGFDPGQTYSVDMRMDWRSLIPPFSRRSTFTFAPARVEPVMGRLLPITPGSGASDGPVRSIDANLETMQLTLLEDGLAVKKFPIGAVGNPYSAPTPEGGFSIKTKELNHFSSKTHVWMPYSMQFQGDYFLHGWPYWPDGSRYESKYSGGCIRLEEDIAKEVFEWASIGVSLFVHDEPGQPFVFSPTVLEDGDHVREGDLPQVYELKMVNGKKFKRRFFGETVNVIPLVSGGLDDFIESRWVQHRGGEGESVYEVDHLGYRRELSCGKTPYSSAVSEDTCYSVWELFGGDYDELFTISSEEWQKMSAAEGQRLAVR